MSKLKAKKLAPKFSNWWEDPWCETYLAEKYLVKKEKEEVIGAIKVEASGVVDAATAAAIEDQKNMLCSKPGCKKKTRADCLHKMCFECCIEQPAEPFCPGHIQKKLSKQEDVRLLEEALSGKKKKTKFYHWEDKFMDFGQTVVIWCLKDFCRNKRFSEDVMAQSLKEERQRLLQIKRDAAAATVAASTTAASATASGKIIDSANKTQDSTTSTNNITGNKRSRKSVSLSSSKSSEDHRTDTAVAAAAVSIKEEGSAEVKPSLSSAEAATVSVTTGTSAVVVAPTEAVASAVAAASVAGASTYGGEQASNPRARKGKGQNKRYATTDDSGSKETSASSGASSSSASSSASTTSTKSVIAVASASTDPSSVTTTGTVTTTVTATVNVTGKSSSSSGTSATASATTSGSGKKLVRSSSNSNCSGKSNSSGGKTKNQTIGWVRGQPSSATSRRPSSSSFEHKHRPYTVTRGAVKRYAEVLLKWSMPFPSKRTDPSKVLFAPQSNCI